MGNVPPNTGTPRTKIEEYLVDTNRILTEIYPMIGLAGLAVRGVVELFRKNGEEQKAKEFEQEAARWDAAHANLGDAIAEFRRKYPKPPIDDGLSSAAGKQP